MFSIAIDGPAGAGKSSVAKEIAKRLDIFYMDTGALYRAVAYYFIGRGALENNNIVFDESIEDGLINIKYIEKNQNIFLYDNDITSNIRTEKVAKFASFISTVEKVRSYILKIERDFAKENSVVMDGRDIGTIVLPNANLKIFLTASIKTRAKRRFEELKNKGNIIEFHSVFGYIKERDKQDKKRKIAPLKAAKDYFVVDTTNLSLCQTIDRLMSLVNKKIYKKIK